MDIGLTSLLLMSLVLGGIVLVRDRANLWPTVRDSLAKNWRMLVRVPAALLAATLLAELMPLETITPWIGPQSGWTGIFVASAAGAFFPGGPALTFPIALVIWNKGAGEAQMIALLASWSIFALHRVVAYELPMLGPRFVGLRLASSWMLPPLAGGIGLALLHFR